MPTLRPPRPPHGRRLLIAQIDQVAREEPDRPWISVPEDNSDLSKGFRDISFVQFANAANNAARWLRANLNLPSEGFPAFAYAGPGDFRYPVFAVAAGKLGYQMILPGATITAEGQFRILEQKGCSVYLYTPETEPRMEEVKALSQSLKGLRVPELEELMTEAAEPIAYEKTWDEAKDDPWLVLHTSGTTGFPKVITYSQQALGKADVVMGLEDIGENSIMLFVNSRLYLPMAAMHYVSMFTTLGTALFTRCVPVFGPIGQPPTPLLVTNILKYAQIDGALLVPAVIDRLCRDEESLAQLRNLKYLQYAGAPLNVESGRLLAPYIRILPAIGSTDCGAYFTISSNIMEDWDYVTFQPHAGAVLEHRVDDKYELVFVRNPECWMQATFDMNPDLDRFETKDLWIEHPTRKGQWKIVGRSDDFVNLSTGRGLFVMPLELILTENPCVRNALIGGQSKTKPIVLIELDDKVVANAVADDGKVKLVENLKPYIERINQQCHKEVHLDASLLVFGTPEKPWPRTLKDTVVRSKTIAMYEPEIEAAYRKAGIS